MHTLSAQVWAWAQRKALCGRGHVRIAKTAYRGGVTCISRHDVHSTLFAAVVSELLLQGLQFVFTVSRQDDGRGCLPHEDATANATTTTLKLLPLLQAVGQGCTNAARRTKHERNCMEGGRGESEGGKAEPEAEAEAEAEGG